MDFIGNEELHNDRTRNNSVVVLLFQITRNYFRHSISNISDAIRSHIQRDSFNGLGRHLSLKNADFARLSAAVVHLFQKKKLQENELTALQEAVRNLTTSEAGPLIYDYYKDKLIKKGMVILREKIKHETGRTLLTKLGEQWNYFYREILPVLQALLYPVKTKTFTIRQMALLEFRNTVLLKLPVKDALQEMSKTDPVSPAIQQMMLVLHGVHEYPCTDNSVKLEKLVARVTSPHLGIMGLYFGRSEPDIRSYFKPPPGVPLHVISKIADDATESDEETTPVDQTFKRADQSPKARHLFQKRNSGIIHNRLLEAVKEQERGEIRRYSIATP